MLVHELNRDQLNELKEAFAIMEAENNGESVNMDKLLESHESISDEEVFEYYDGTIFSDDDFMCSEE